MKVTKQHRVKWSVGRMHYDTTIPKGLRVQFLESPSGGRWVLDEFPVSVFPMYTIERSDAIHYGITISEENIEDKL